MQFPTPAFLHKIHHSTASLRDLPRPWVFTNGCFDILHLGHAACLAQAKTLGPTLIVGVN
ncbi:MAG: hypothetical protein RLZZ502_1237, partial [Pseudomonadota bacterium]